MKVISLLTISICCGIGGFLFYIFCIQFLMQLPLLGCSPSVLIFYALWLLYILFAFTPLALFFKSRASHKPKLYFALSLFLGLVVIALFWPAIRYIFPNYDAT